MRLTVLGSAGTYPGARSGCSAYLVEQDGFRVLLDAGNGAVGGLQRHGDVFALDAVLLSHLHADHCVDLCAYTYARLYHPDGPRPPVALWGPAGTLARLAGIFDSPPPDGLADSFAFHQLRAGRFELGPFQVTAARMAHPAECYGVRLEAGGRSLVYSADTGPTEALVGLARDADLLLCEASWPDRPDLPAGVHMTGSQAGEHAAAAGVARLVITHLVPWVSEPEVRGAAERAFGAPVAVAHADDTFDV
jgi:ribonuclease BN (tRNA processing enzyme)